VTQKPGESDHTLNDGSEKLKTEIQILPR